MPSFNNLAQSQQGPQTHQLSISNLMELIQGHARSPYVISGRDIILFLMHQCPCHVAIAMLVAGQVLRSPFAEHQEVFPACMECIADIVSGTNLRINTFLSWSSFLPYALICCTLDGVKHRPGIPAKLDLSALNSCPKYIMNVPLKMQLQVPRQKRTNG
jgi:hypothetical protein